MSQLIKYERKTIDYVLRTTWLAVQRMYNEEASKFEATMTTAFTLLSIYLKDAIYSFRQKWEEVGLSRILKTLEKRDLIVRSQT